MLQQLTRGVNGRLDFHPPEGIIDDGEATLLISDDDGNAWASAYDLVQDAATADVDAAEDGSRTLTVSTITGFVRSRRYILVLPSGHWFEVVLQGIEDTGSGCYLTLSEPLPMTLPTGTIIRGWVLTHAVSSTLTGETKRGISAKWSYAVNGETLSYIERFEVVPDPFRVAITEADIREKAVDWGDFRGAATARWRSLIAGAHDDIDRRLRENGVYPDLVRDRAQLKGAVINALLAKMHRVTGSALEAGYLADVEKDISSLLAQPNRYDTDGSGTATSGDPRRLPGGGKKMKVI